MALSSRRERPPSSRHNLSARNESSTTLKKIPPLNINSTIINSNNIRPLSASAVHANNNSSSSSSLFLNSNRIASERRPVTAVPSNNNSNASTFTQNSRVATERRPMTAVKSNNLTSRSNDTGRRPSSNILSTSNDPVTYYRREQFQNQNNDAGIEFEKTLNTNNTNQNDMESFTLSSSLNTIEDVLKQIEIKKQLDNQKYLELEVQKLGKYNAFSRPKKSEVLPLRSVLLDPEVNNFPPSKTRSELMKKIKATFIPHPSYDLDGDGYVSQEDYKAAKRFDFDNNGIIDPEEKQLGSRILTEEFFQIHNKDTDLPRFSPELSLNSHRTNVNTIASSINYNREFERLKSLERAYRKKGSHEASLCLTLSNPTSLSLIKHNYYTNKFDTTAWNDYDAIPRAFSGYGQDTGFGQGTGYGGSRKRMLFVRKQELREKCLENMLKSNLNNNNTLLVTRRVNLITDPSVENS